jgi:hypothetical protein
MTSSKQLTDPTSGMQPPDPSRFATPLSTALPLVGCPNKASRVAVVKRHAGIVRSPIRGESSRKKILDPPAMGTLIILAKGRHEGQET